MNLVDPRDTEHRDKRLLFMAFATKIESVPVRFYYSTSFITLEREHICRPNNCALYPKDFFGVKSIVPTNTNQRRIHSATDYFINNVSDKRGNLLLAELYFEAIYSNGEHSIIKNIYCDRTQSQDDLFQKDSEYRDIIFKFCSKIERVFSADEENSPLHDALLYNPRNREQYYITSAFASIGRNPACNIHIDDLIVSRTHAAIEHSNQCWFIIDTNSKNGVLLNGLKIEPNSLTKIVDGDVISITNEHHFIFLEYGIANLNSHFLSVLLYYSPIP